MGNIIRKLKKIPIDLGQGNLRYVTKGKLIAEALVPLVNSKKKLCLDIGCREGYQSEKLLALGYEVTSIDIECSYTKCIYMDANKPLSFSDSYFDLIWCSEVIEHLDNPRAFVKECKRILKPEGVMILTTPNSCFWLYSVAKLFNKSARDLQNPGHKHFFSINEIRSIFPQAEIYGYFPYIGVKFTIKKFIGLLSPTFVVKIRN